MKPTKSNPPKPAILILREGARSTIDLDDLDASLIISALKLSNTTRNAAITLLGLREEETPLTDARELALIKLLEAAPQKPARA